MSRPLRLMIYDETCRGQGLRPGLTHSWIAGALLYGALGRIDRWQGVSSWNEGLAWLATHESIGEVQFWGHGKWGSALVGKELLDVHSLRTDHPHRPHLETLRARMAPDALWWFRTCETFGARAGHNFAMAWTDFFARPAAGHTFIIGPWQSGLHKLEPQATPHWSEHEGLDDGDPKNPLRALWSSPRMPNTITCLGGRVPSGW